MDNIQNHIRQICKKSTEERSIDGIKVSPPPPPNPRK